MSNFEIGDYVTARALRKRYREHYIRQGILISIGRRAVIELFDGERVRVTKRNMTKVPVENIWDRDILDKMSEIKSNHIGE